MTEQETGQIHQDPSACLHVAIRSLQVLPLLLKSAPGFETTWNEHILWWNGEERGEFIDAAEFARYVVDSYEAGKTIEFEAIFAMIERVVREGDEDARGLATVGILETIQNAASWRTFGYTVFAKWLGPLSLQAWQEIETLWQDSGGSLAGVIRHESQQEKRA